MLHSNLQHGLIQFFLIASIFLNAKDGHQQYHTMKQDCCSIAGGFKCAAREFHGVHWVAIAIREIHFGVGILELYFGVGLDQFF
jgi:hypothetical protein